MMMSELIPADIPHYRAVFSQILDALEQVSPLVEGADLGCIYIGVDGLQLIYPNDSALINAVSEVAADFMPQMGIAENKFLASLAAQQSQPNDCKILWGDIASFLKELSCDVLPVSMKSKSKLRDFGIRTLGQVAAMLPGPLQSQFGPEGKRIWELAQGIDDTPLYPRFMEEVIEESVTLPSVTVSMDAIMTSAESISVTGLAGHRPQGTGYPQPYPVDAHLERGALGAGYQFQRAGDGYKKCRLSPQARPGGLSPARARRAGGHKG